MAWVAINKDYAANDETATIVTRSVQCTGFENDKYQVSDDPMTVSTNHGYVYDSFEDRVNDRLNGGCSVVQLPYGVGYEDALDMIRFYGRI